MDNGTLFIWIYRGTNSSLILSSHYLSILYVTIIILDIFLKIEQRLRFWWNWEIRENFIS